MSEDNLFTEPEEEVTPEPTPEPEPTPTPEPEPEKTVPLAALNEARHEMREFKEQMRQKEEQFNSLKSELDEWRKSQQQGKEADEFATDPLGTLHREVVSLKEQQAQAQTQAQERQDQQRAVENLQSWAAQRVNEYKANDAEYDAKLEHVMSVRGKELETLGYPPAQIPKILQQEAMNIMQDAYNRGINPAETVNQLAMYRGYQSAKPGKDLVDAAKKLEEGQKAAQTLSGSQGGPDNGLKDIADMSDEEFDKYWDEQMK